MSDFDDLKNALGDFALSSSRTYAGEPFDPTEQLKDGIPYAVVPPDHHIEDLEAYLPKPVRRRGHFVAENAASFVDYIKIYEGDDTRLYASLENLCVVSIIDDLPQGNKNSWRDHKAVYRCARSEDWLAWNRRNKDMNSQTEFAEFIEDHIDDIVSPEDTKYPTGADMLEIATNMRVKKNIDVKSAVRLANGKMQFSYENNTEGMSGTGNIAIPEEFSLGLPVFVDGDKYQVIAKLRYRLKDGNLTLGYKLMKTDKILREAFNGVVSYVADQTGRDVLMGNQTA